MQQAVEERGEDGNDGGGWDYFVFFPGIAANERDENRDMRQDLAYPGDGTGLGQLLSSFCRVFSRLSGSERSASNAVRYIKSHRRYKSSQRRSNAAPAGLEAHLRVVSFRSKVRKQIGIALAKIENAIKDNRSLQASKTQKQDEFYTQITTVEEEVRHYRKHFRGKVVLCNCDDPFESNFFKYFALNFNKLGLRRLIATCYDGSPIVGTQLQVFGETLEEAKKTPYKAVVNVVRDADGDGDVDMFDVAKLFELGENQLTKLNSNGDFRSPECVELLGQADIVVTNPPFSLFREYLRLIIEHDKKFLIIGNQNAITYKETFPLLMGNKVWLGYHSGHTLFAVPETYEIPGHFDGSDRARIRGAGYKVDENGRLWRDLGNICWYTNLDHRKRHESLVLFKRYTPEDYPRYENYDAIEVSKVANIPCDYAGVMGVPITFMDKYSPDQFEILGMCENLDMYGLKTRVYTPQECRARYFELFGKPGTYDLNAAGVVNGRKTYQRILIRNKHPEEPRA